MAAPPRPDSLALLDRLMAALVAKGIVTEAEVAERQASTDKASPETGARMIARAWTDPAYRALLLSDGKAAAEAMGVSMAGAPPLGVLENTPTRHHLVVCTLCSCYPRAVLGYPPNWYKSFAYRSRAVREPRAVLAEWGLNLPDAPRRHRGLGRGPPCRPRHARRHGRRRGGEVALISHGPARRRAAPRRRRSRHRH
jgi:hypothetical protein